MKTIIGVRKEDLLKLLKIALEKEQKRKLNNEICHFDFMLYPALSSNEDFLVDNYLYHVCIEYFTSSSLDDYIQEICKIDFEIPAVVILPDNSKKNLPILIGLAGIDIQEMIDVINKIDNETIELEINPIEVDGMLSCSIMSIEDLFSASNSIKIF